MFSYWISQFYSLVATLGKKSIPVVFHIDCLQRRGFSSERFS